MLVVFPGIINNATILPHPLIPALVPYTQQQPAIVTQAINMCNMYESVCVSVYDCCTL